MTKEHSLNHSVSSFTLLEGPQLAVKEALSQDQTSWSSAPVP
jgi:hypothetical protein